MEEGSLIMSHKIRLKEQDKCNLEKRRLKHALLSSNVFILFVRIFLGVTFSKNWAQGHVPGKQELLP